MPPSNKGRQLDQSAGRVPEGCHDEPEGGRGWSGARGCFSPTRFAAGEARLSLDGSSRRSGRLARTAAAWLLALAVVAAAVAPAHAQEVTLWTATLTPADIGGQLGCVLTVGFEESKKCSNTSVLSSDSFSHGATTYTVDTVLLQEGSLSALSFGLTSGFSNRTNWTLQVGSKKLAISSGNFTGNTVVWVNATTPAVADLDWTAGTAVQLKLTTKNTAATGKPTITGNLAKGQTLSVSTSAISDRDGKTKADNGDAGFAYTHQWIKVVGAVETVAGTGETFVIPDASSTYKVKTSFKDDLGFLESRTSDAVDVLRADTGLDDISLTAGALTERNFLPETISIPNTLTTVDILTSGLSAGATLSYLDGNDAPLAHTEVSGGIQISLSVGKNTVKLRVTAEDGFNKRDYVITVVRGAAAPTGDCDAILCANLTTGYFTFDEYYGFKSLFAGEEVRIGLLEPEQFELNELTYRVESIEYTGTLAFIQISPLLPAGKYVLEIGAARGSFRSRGNSFNHTIDDSSFANLAEDVGEVYPLKLRRVSTDATLSALAVAHGSTALSFDHPDFDKDATTYYLSVANAVSTLKVTPSTADDGARVDYLDASNTPITDTVPGTAGTLDARLSVGANVIKVKVTAEDDDTTKTYTIHVARAAAAPTATCDVIWCANLTVGWDDADPPGTSYGYDKDAGTALVGGLNRRTFTHGAQSYAVEDFSWNSAGELVLAFDRNFPDGNYLLEIGGRSIEVSPDTGDLLSKSTSRSTVQRLSRTFGAVLAVRLSEVGGPGAPTGLSATGNGPSQIDLSWSAPADDGGSPVTGYKVEWSASGNAPWTELVASHDRTTYSHTGLTAGTTHHYRVFALNAEGTSDPSNTARATTQTTDTTGPGFADAAVPAAGTHVHLTMSEDLDTTRLPPAGAFAVTAQGEDVGVAAVEVRAGVTDGVSLRLSRTVHASQEVRLSYTDPSASNDTAALQDSHGNDAASFANRAVTNGSTVPLPAVTVDFEDSRYTFLEETAAHTVRVVARTLANAPPGAGFEVEVSTDASAPPGKAAASAGGDFRSLSQAVAFAIGDFSREGAVYVARKSVTVTVIDDTDVEGTEYFRLRLEATGDTPSAVRICTVVDCPALVALTESDVPATMPSKVQGLVLTPGDRRIDVEWDATALATSYRVEWKSGTEPYAPERRLTLEGASITSAALTGLENLTEYTVRVIATNVRGDGPASDEQSATPGLPDNVPVVGIWPIEKSVVEGEPARFRLRLVEPWGLTVTVNVRVRGEGRGRGAGGFTREFFSKDLFPAQPLEHILEVPTDHDGYPGPEREVVLWIVAKDGQFRTRAEARVRVLDKDAAVVRQPSAPRGLDALTGNGEVTLVWQAPASDGGDEVTDYQYRVWHESAFPGPIAGRTHGWESTGSTRTRLVLDGLTNDALPQSTYYFFEVRAVNDLGAGPASNRAAARPTVWPNPGRPTRPRNLTAEPDDAGAVDLRWEAAQTLSPPLRYEYLVQDHESGHANQWQFDPGQPSDAVWREAGSGTMVRVTERRRGQPLELERPYVFKVRAVNARGAASLNSNEVWAVPREGTELVSAQQGGDAGTASIAGASIASTPPYPAGSRVEVAVRFTQEVHVDTTLGHPTVGVRVGAALRDARYASGSGSTTLTFAWVVTGEGAGGRVFVVSDTLALNGGTIRDGEGRDAETAFHVAPGVVSLAIADAPGEDGRWDAGDAVELDVRFSEAVHVDTSGGTPAIALLLGTAPASAAYASGSGSEVLRFAHTLGDDAPGANAVLVAPDALALHGGAIRGASGLDAALAHAGVSRLLDGEEGPEDETDEEDPDPPPPPLTASFSKTVAAHAERAFYVFLDFSAAVATDAAGIRAAVSVQGGTLVSALRSGGRRDRFQLQVTPSGTGAVTLTLAGGRACAEAGAVCTGAGVALSGTATLTVPGPTATTPAPFTARFVDPPKAHDTTTPFTVRIVFSEPLDATSRGRLRSGIVDVVSGRKDAVAAVGTGHTTWDVTRSETAALTRAKL